MWVGLLLFTLTVTNNVYAAKILGIFPVTSRSHYILGSSLMRELAEKGHEVTVVSPFGEKDPPKNVSYRDIVLTGLAEQHDKRIQELKIFERPKWKMAIMAPMMLHVMITMTEEALNHTNLQKLIHSEETFDLVIIEEFMNHAQKALATHFKAHLIILSTIGASSWVNGWVANPTPISYVSDPILGYTSNMTFRQRIASTLSYLFGELMKHFYLLPKQQELVNKYIPNGANLDEVIYNASLILLNSHISTSSPVPCVPQMIDIGGFHVKPPKKLPHDLQNYLDSSKNGVIYFSLGSNMKSSLIPEKKREAFIHVFSKLPYDVLWKWEEDVLPGKPANVRIEKWLPQQDILPHPNVKLFITHAGLLSTTEIIYHGIPVLAIPLGGDQNLNAQQIVDKGFGLMLPFQELTAEELLIKINQLLSDNSYRKNAQERSRLFHDRLVTPMDTAVYWVEYVLRHGGTSHLRVAGLDLPWYKYHLLDVLAFMGLASLIGLYISFKIMKKIIGTCWRQNKQKLKKH